MRYIAIAFVLLSFPALVAWLKGYPRQRHLAYFGIGLLPFTVTHWNLDAALISWAHWPGYVKGLIVTLLDTLALAVIVTHRQPRGLPPFSWFVIAYILAGILSMAGSDVPAGTAFYPFQVLRMLIVIVAVAKIAGNPSALNSLAGGLMFGICYQAGFTIWQKAGGAFQASGTMGHQNLLGMMTHFVTFPLLAMLLSGSRRWWLMIGVTASLIVVALGASRATIGFGLMGMVVLVALSLARRPTAKKWKIIGYGALALALVSPFMLQGIRHRLGQLAQESGYDERAAFERTAKAIWADHPMGVGANQYVVSASTKGYSERAGVAWNWTSRAANVHNTYLLVAAETGWAGLLTFMGMFGAVAWGGLRFAFRNRLDPRGDVVLGCTVAVIVCAVHNLYEWIWVRYEVQYLFGISVGIIAGMIRMRAIEMKRARRAAAAQAAGQPRIPPVGAVAAGARHAH